MAFAGGKDKNWSSLKFSELMNVNDGIIGDRTGQDYVSSPEVLWHAVLFPDSHSL